MPNYSFPATKWVKNAKINDQFKHVVSEMFEVLTADGRQEEIKEMVDLYHSLETFFRILERDGIKVDGYFKQIQKKNEERGYYRG